MDTSSVLIIHQVRVWECARVVVRFRSGETKAKLPLCGLAELFLPPKLRLNWPPRPPRHNIEAAPSLAGHVALWAVRGNGSKIVDLSSSKLRFLFLLLLRSPPHDAGRIGPDLDAPPPARRARPTQLRSSAMVRDVHERIWGNDLFGSRRMSHLRK